MLDSEKLFHQTAANAIISQYKPIETEDIARDSASKHTPLDLYIHIPFCQRICDYCAYERKTAPPSRREQFVAGLVDYLPQVLPPYYQDHSLLSLAIGGGTPSLLAVDQIDRLLSSVNSVVDLSQTTITVELHPRDVTTDYLDGLKKAGVNRLSVGIQNFTPGQKVKMGRSSGTQQRIRDLVAAEDTSEEARCLDVLNSAGTGYNLDLLYGTTGQTLDNWKTNLAYTVDRFNPPEITVYPYIRAYGSKLYDQLQNRAGLWGRRKMHLFAKDYLTKMGYRQTDSVTYIRDNLTQSSPYTISSEWNFLGIGPRAYSRIVTKNGVWYFIDPENTDDYINHGSDHSYYGIKTPNLLDKAMTGLMLSTSGFAYGRGGIPMLACHPEVFVLSSAILYAILNSPKFDKLSSPKTPKNYAGV